jgi:hypothetical protein
MFVLVQTGMIRSLLNWPKLNILDLPKLLIKAKLAR